jgi:hypothetical protein
MSDRDAFFVGYDPRSARPLLRFLGVVAALIMAGFAALSLLIATTASTPGAGGFAGEIDVSGVMRADPYPLILAAPDAAHPLGRALMLTGDGKLGVQAMAKTYDGRSVSAHGLLLKRGDNNIRALPDQQAAPLAETDLGRWRIAGEICDGKCYAGAMRPGTGLAHKACANLCIDGGAPPVFVSAEPVEGAQFFLLADENGKQAPALLTDLVARPVVLEGALRRIGDLTILRADWSKAATP